MAVQSEHGGSTAGGAEQIQDGPDRRRLSGAIGAQKAEYLTDPHLEVEIDDPRNLAVVLGEFLGEDHSTHRVLHACNPS